jgi:hypothetical protein
MSLPWAPPETLEIQYEGIVPGMSRAEVLEQLAKLRERGDLSGAEYLRARRELLGE